jgi:hypothetical protein
MTRILRRLSMETICWVLRPQGWRTNDDILFSRFAHRPSNQAIGNALRHARRYGFVKSRIVGPGNRSEWRITDAGRKAARNPFNPH